MLLCSALLANLSTSRWDGQVFVSGSFVATILAIAFLGPATAVIIGIVTEFVYWRVVRIPFGAALDNIVGNVGPTIVVGSAFVAMAPRDGLGFYAALGVAAALHLTLNFVVVTVLPALQEGKPALAGIRAGLDLAPTVAINVLLCVAAAEIYATVGLGAMIFVLASMFAFTYMARLVVTARERATKYAALSWGVLSGLIRTLDHRDARAARHAAAVAAFARDIAQSVGLSPRECELAHTAGLLHDIGRFGLSDRVMERGRTLTEQDWDTIRQHPVMGADLLRDLGVYGPVAEIVLAHHERIDGRGYPNRLSADEIPEIAKIVAVAEVYDTLTADDTYRTPVSSFEALNELRRCSGTQFEGRYVEALSELLAGRGVEYRHADTADFDEELELERRIGEAVGVTSPVDKAASIDKAAGENYSPAALPLS